MIFEPHPYQAYCTQRIITDPAIALFLDMGLGKTVITLSAIKDLKYYRFCVSKVLIIAPKKVAEATWNKEAAKWDHLKMLRISNVLGSKMKRVRAVESPADIYIVNRENVEWIVDYFRNDWPFDMVVIDESSSFKSHKAKRFKALALVRSRIKRIVELTGTPAPNGLTDLWAQLYLLDQGQRLERKISYFREKYFDPGNMVRIANGGQVPGSYQLKDGAEDKIKSLISDICISMKAEDYLQLPEQIFNDIPVALDDKAAKLYRKLEREMLLNIDEQIIDVGSAAALTNKLLQLCNGAVYTDTRDVVEIHDCKLQALFETVESLEGQPVLLFYNFQHDVPRILKTLESLKLKIRMLKCPQDETDWNNKQIDVLLAHPASCAYGLNLQDGGNHMIWFSLNWSLELFQQACKRLHRQGQKQKVIIHRLYIVDGRDEDVITALEDKAGTQESLIQSLKVRIEKIRKGD